ncbi:site-2 protease family protein [Nocardioides sp. YIM 152588]|uniref:site-2 protease family protein n=1 Tax=Nocardioides sp. YIM 152588 TaxID=3158259 RepID=UPI0032E48CFE
MLRIGSIAGSDVLVSSSWFLVAALIAFVMAPRVDQIAPGLGPLKYVVGLLFAVVLYGAVLLHEASHAVVAQRFGFRVESITLHFLGGATAIDGEARTPRQEFWIAVVGPITSLGVGLAALALWFVTPGGVLLLIVEGLAWTNLLIGVLNLVPALPLDGGRVLKAGVWALTGRARTGTLVAGWAGRVAAAGVVLWALVQAQLVDSSRGTLSPLMAVIVAVFLWMGASQALQAAEVRDQIGRIVARDLARRTLAVPAELPLAEAIRRAQAAEAGSIVTVTSAGAPVGVVDERAAAAVPGERRPWVATSTVARSVEPGLSLPASITGEALVEAIRRTPASEYVLVEEDGTLCGVLATADVARVVRSGG